MTWWRLVCDVWRVESEFVMSITTPNLGAASAYIYWAVCFIGTEKSLRKKKITVKPTNLCAASFQGRIYARLPASAYDLKSCHHAWREANRGGLLERRFLRPAWLEAQSFEQFRR